MTGVPDSETPGDKQPEAEPLADAGRVPVIAMSLAALAIIGAATANSSSFSGFSLPDFSQLVPSADRFPHGPPSRRPEFAAPAPRTSFAARPPRLALPPRYVTVR